MWAFRWWRFPAELAGVASRKGVVPSPSVVWRKRQESFLFAPVGVVGPLYDGPDLRWPRWCWRGGDLRCRLHDPDRVRRACFVFAKQGFDVFQDFAIWLLYLV